jgi:hypothetical protein
MRVYTFQTTIVMHPEISDSILSSIVHFLAWTGGDGDADLHLKGGRVEDCKLLAYKILDIAEALYPGHGWHIIHFGESQEKEFWGIAYEQSQVAISVDGFVMNGGLQIATDHYRVV